ncbi:acyltransferase family protein [Parabacteroides sp. APC149_11_2_Y6]
MEQATTYKRLESLDVLRGFDLFCLVALEGVLHPLGHAIDASWYNSFLWWFSHVQWEGFSSWDLVMPLFMFMAGVSMPFALSRYKTMPDKMAVYRRIGKRVLLLWIFGMMCQGNLLGLDPDRIYLYSNTLQSIAMGYLIAALLFLHVRPAIQIATAVVLLLVYWGAMQFISVDGFGGGNYTPDGNLAEWIDRVVLGRFRDGAVVQDGQVIFLESYRYTWILSSLNFGVTVLTGLFAGQILKSDRAQKRKYQLLFIIGTIMVAAGWLWGLQLPVIKKIWTSSMVLVSSGYCFLLMGLFYYWIDYKGHRRNITWLKVYGMNSIVAYMLANVVSFKCIGTSLFHGLEQYIGNYYPALIAVSNALIIYVILWLLYKRNIFLKV